MTWTRNCKAVEPSQFLPLSGATWPLGSAFACVAAPFYFPLCSPVFSASSWDPTSHHSLAQKSSWIWPASQNSNSRFWGNKIGLAPPGLGVPHWPNLFGQRRRGYTVEICRKSPFLWMVAGGVLRGGAHALGRHLQTFLHLSWKRCQLWA